MKVLIIGNGGREHAIAWKVAQSPLVTKVFVAPGNAGTAQEPLLENINIKATDVSGLLTFAQQEKIDLTIVGPEAPLVIGIVDSFQKAGLQIFGPTKAAAQLEGSKAFTKDFLARHHIPTATYQNFTEIDPAIAYVREQGAPIVIKADGLAAGKGVIVAMTLKEAEAAIRDMLAGNAFGDAGHRIVIEEFLDGEEASFIVMVDGKHVEPMATSQDHKRAFDGDTGPNTGGMGAYSPAPVVTNTVFAKVMEQIIYPTINGMAQEGNPYTGFLYAGLMIDKQGNPKVIEFNCRFGDPETQPIIMRLQSDLVALCLAATAGTLDSQKSQWDPRPALGVVMAAGGYPGQYNTQDEIIGLPTHSDQDCKVFHAGTSLEKGKICTHGGRVLCVTALGDTVLAAQTRAYQQVNDIHWHGCFYRHDIGYRAIAREIAAQDTLAQRTTACDYTEQDLVNQHAAE
ncbi:phosphoribosylamine--glycine ligase [Orbaceae bacterium ESL0727]|nr:phosphoribosylamine--glycine ligase [Orbaceae bacterium ESL0727]